MQNCAAGRQPRQIKPEQLLAAIIEPADHHTLDGVSSLHIEQQELDSSMAAKPEAQYFRGNTKRVTSKRTWRRALWR